MELAEVASMSPMYKSKKSYKFNRKRPYFDREKYRWKRGSSPRSYNHEKFVETRDFSRCDALYPQAQTWENCIKGPPLETINPNCDFLRVYDTFSPQFQNPSLDIPRKCDTLFPDPGYDFMSPWYQIPTRDYYSRNFEADSHRFQSSINDVPKEGPIADMNPSRDYYSRNFEADPHRFQSSRNDVSKEGPITYMNPTREFSRKSDSGTRSQVRPSENPEGTFENSTPRREFSRRYGSVSPQFRVRTSKKRKERSFAKVKPTHKLSRKYEDVSHKEAIENHKGGPIVKRVRTCKRKRNADCPRIEVKNSEKPIEAGINSEKSKDGMVEKVKLRNGSIRKCDGVSPQLQLNTSEVPNKGELFEGLVTNAANSEPTKATVSCGNFKVRNVDAFRIFPKNSGANRKDGTTVKINSSHDFMKISDADSLRVEATTSEDSKEGLIEKVDQINDLSRKCVGSSQIKETSKILNEAKPSEVSVTCVKNCEPTNPAMPYNNFKIRKFSADRKFPKHCGALAPRVSVRRNDENLVVNEEGNTKSEVASDNIEGIEPGLEVVDVEEVVNEVKAVDLEKILNEPILPNDFEKVANEPVLFNGVEKVLNEPISTNAPAKLALSEFVESFDSLKDHTHNDNDGVAPIDEPNHPSADNSLECEGEEGKTLKTKPGHYLSLFEEHLEETCSEDEGNFVDTACLYKFDLLTKAIFPFIGCETINKRKQVKKTMDSYNRILVKVLKDNEAALSAGNEKVYFQPSIEAALLLKNEKKWVNTKQALGHVPGVEVGDRFQFRAELTCIGLHRMFQGGIDYMKTDDGKVLATCIVDSGRYANDAESCDVLVYCGQGGNPMLAKNKQPQDQKLERGNLALKNSMEAKTPVRVIRKDMKSVLRYYYDGLYVVTNFTQERSPYGKLAYKFQLNRIISAEANITQVEKKLPCLVEDISQGKEKIPIHVVNTVDDEPFPVFSYITHMTYPESCYCHMIGCDCTDECSDSKKCVCFIKNGGEVIFDDKGSIIVEAKSKPFIYECGPSCKCPSSCKNRVSQYGIRYQLEVFKTKSICWGVRSRNYIPAGSFICEYVGELLHDEEAEQRKGNDEYLFDINDDFTIDAAKFGNVGRFINHSCSPNLYAQHVLYDHGNKRMPHVMFFAVNGIFPFQELTYDYNYKLDKVLDSEGNIKRKTCHCGSRGCSGRLY